MTCATCKHYERTIYTGLQAGEWSGICKFPLPLPVLDAVNKTPRAMKVYAEATGCPCWTALEEKP